MAFCPNCGAPTTEQAEKCVSCGHQLSSQQKARFKGTIMMSPVQAAAAPKPAAVAPAPVAPAAAAPAVAAPAAAPPPVAEQTPPPAGGKQFAKTMLGSAIASPLAAYDAPKAAGPAASGDLGSAATMHGSAVPYARTVEATPVSAPQPVAREAPSTEPVAAPRVSAERTPPPFAQPPEPPVYRAPEPPPPAAMPRMPSQLGLGAAGEPESQQAQGSGRALLFGLGGAFAVAVLGGGALYAFGGSKLLGGSDAEVAQAWKQSVGQAVTQVAQLCSQDCNAAAVYFHPQTQAALLPQAKQLTPARAARLSAAESEAHMLADTDASPIATKLGLDPARCVQLLLGGAQAVGCSVSDGAGNESLRLVHLAGIDTL